jgi:ribosomal-protein-alanine N-acetyltransferase
MVEKDKHFFFSLYQDKELMSYVGEFEESDLTKSFHLSLALNQANTNKRLTYVIHQMKNKLGIISLTRSKNASELCEIGTIIRSASLNKGVAAEAVECLIEHGFSHLGVEKIHASHAIDNRAAYRVLKKLNFEIEETKDGFHHSFISKVKRG